jgi:hypothetical protein
MDLPRETSQSPDAGDSSADEALVTALREFIRNAGGPIEQVAAAPEGKESSAPIGWWQGITLLLFAVDLAILYSFCERWFQTPLLENLLKVVPWMLGAAAVGFADKVRLFLVAQASHLRWAGPAAGLAVVLLSTQMPLFSVRVRLNPGTAAIKPYDIKDGCVNVLPTEDPSAFRLTFPALEACRVMISDNEARPGDTVPFTPTVGRRSILHGTLVQVPLLGRIFGKPEITFTPLYRAKFHSPEDEANLRLLVSGEFSKEFLNATPCKPDPVRKVSALICPIGGGLDWVSLPPATYDFTLVEGDCRRAFGKKEVKAGENDTIEASDVTCIKS